MVFGCFLCSPPSTLLSASLCAEHEEEISQHVEAGRSTCAGSGSSRVVYGLSSTTETCRRQVEDGTVERKEVTSSDRLFLSALSYHPPMAPREEYRLHFQPPPTARPSVSSVTVAVCLFFHRGFGLCSVFAAPYPQSRHFLSVQKRCFLAPVVDGFFFLCFPVLFSIVIQLLKGDVVDKAFPVDVQEISL